MALILYETEAQDGDDVVPVRLCNGQGYNHPSAPGFYEPAMLFGGDGFRVKQQIFSDRRSFGFGARDGGFIRLANPGEFDHLIEAGFGRPARVLVGEGDWPYDTFTPLLLGVASGVEPDPISLTIGWRDRSEELDRPLQGAVFAGTNSGVAGLEGTPDDIGGQRKPYTGGRILNFAPVLLNASTRIMGWRFSQTGARLPSASLDVVRVLGSDNWVSIGDYPNAAALQAAAALPETGEYATCLAESLVMIGGNLPGSLAGVVAIDATIEETENERYLGTQIADLLLKAGVTAGKISGADINSLNLQCPYQVQVAVTDETAREVLNMLMASALVCGWVDASDTYRFRRMQLLDFQAPAATLKNLTEGAVQGPYDADIVAVQGVLSAGPERDVPVCEVQVRYARYGLVLSSDAVAAAVPDDQAAALSQEYRVTEPARDDAALAKYPNAGRLVHDTLLVHLADAEAVRDDLLALLSQYRLTLEVTVALTPDLTLGLGSVCDVVTPYFGFGEGRRGQVLDFTLNASNNTATLQLWMAPRG